MITTTTTLQFYGLIFLLGSFTVSSISDLKRLAAQKDFAEVWGLYTLTAFIIDGITNTGDPNNLALVALKWMLIITVAVITTTNKLGIRLAMMDTAAITALASTLPPIQAITSLILILLLNEILTPILRNISKSNAYPFLPIIWLANLTYITINALNLPQTLQTII